MKTLIFGLLLGIIIGAGGYWYMTADRTTPGIQEAEERAASQAEKAYDSVRAAGEQVKEALAAKLEAFELRSEDIQQELAEQGRVVRRKARDIGEVATDAAVDSRATAIIKARLAADPDLSALSISVSTTKGQVTLSGTVASAELIGKAMALALEVEGVREVVSTLQIG
ncbi:BON domain-containing protein [Desulfatiglans anilini]|uniref:BON domain-containing protein n=1 Tax=Desulfatiglans anilini TaxID=90728 RepID=UPI0004095A8E|nr:BON domain-containing protein [Desulfatiglans anilini]